MDLQGCAGSGYAGSQRELCCEHLGGGKEDEGIKTKRPVDFEIAGALLFECRELTRLHESDGQVTVINRTTWSVYESLPSDSTPKFRTHLRSGLRWLNLPIRHKRYPGNVL